MVGFITETDNLIPIAATNETSEHRKLNLLEVQNYDVNNEKLITMTEEDKERKETIKKVKLETNFYNMFRNILKMILNKNINMKTELLEMLENEYEQGDGVEYKGYLSFKKSIINKFKDIMVDYVDFVSFGTLEVDINDLYNCFGLTKNECSNLSGKCSGFATDNKKCTLLLPKNNLITDKNNKKIYFDRLADELLRKKSIKKYVFGLTNYIHFGEQEYIIKNDEIVVIEELVKENYIKKIMLMEPNIYVNNKTIYQERSRDVNTILIQDDKALVLKDTSFGNDVRKIVVINDVNYTNEKVIELLIKYISVYYKTIKKDEELTIDDIYDSLIMEIKKIEFDDLIEIFKVENKPYKKIRKIEDVEDIVRNEMYAFKPLDIYLILKHYNVPCFIANDDGKHFKYNPSLKMKGMEIAKSSDDFYNSRSNIYNYYKKITMVLKDDQYEITYYVKKTKDIMVNYEPKEIILMGGIEFKPKIKFLYTGDSQNTPNVFMLLLGGVENKTMRFSQVYYKDEENDIGQLNIKSKIFNRGLKKPLPGYIFKSTSYKNIFV